jgi:hypothetical protein
VIYGSQSWVLASTSKKSSKLWSNRAPYWLSTRDPAQRGTLITSSGLSPISRLQIFIKHRSIGKILAVLV